VQGAQRDLVTGGQLRGRQFRSMQTGAQLLAERVEQGQRPALGVRSSRQGEQRPDVIGERASRKRQVSDRTRGESRHNGAQRCIPAFTGSKQSRRRAWSRQPSSEPLLGKAEDDRTGLQWAEHLAALTGMDQDAVAGACCDFTVREAQTTFPTTDLQKHKVRLLDKRPGGLV